MKHLNNSFRTHTGTRGVHFYNESNCNFLTWLEVLDFVKSLGDKQTSAILSEELINRLANYDPDTEFLAIRQSNKTVSIELFTSSNYVEI